jgi:hypothetical protein
MTDRQDEVWTSARRQRSHLFPPGKSRCRPDPPGLSRLAGRDHATPGVSRIFSRVIHYVAQMERWLEYIAVSLRLPGRPHVEFIRWFCKFVSGTLLIISASCVGFFVYLLI